MSKDKLAELIQKERTNPTIYGYTPIGLGIKRQILNQLLIRFDLVKQRLNNELARYIEINQLLGKYNTITLYNGINNSIKYSRERDQLHILKYINKVNDDLDEIKNQQIICNKLFTSITEIITEEEKIDEQIQEKVNQLQIKGDQLDSLAREHDLIRKKIRKNISTPMDKNKEKILRPQSQKVMNDIKNIYDDLKKLNSEKSKLTSIFQNIGKIINDIYSELEKLENKTESKISYISPVLDITRETEPNPSVMETTQEPIPSNAASNSSRIVKNAINIIKKKEKESKKPITKPSVFQMIPGSVGRRYSDQLNKWRLAKKKGGTKRIRRTKPSHKTIKRNIKK